MQWKKNGLVFRPQGEHPELLTHAANPVALHLNGDIYRIFYNGRDVQNRSSVGYVDLDVIHREIISHCNAPVFSFGETGSFYEFGVSIGNVYRDTVGSSFLLFMGWQKPHEEHWRGEIGRVRLTDDLTKAHLDPEFPFLARNPDNPISLSYPFVMPTADGYRMWYGSTITWDAGNGEMLHPIYTALSSNGVTWARQGLAVPYILGTAQAFSRPSVLRDTQGWHMWFSFRGNRPEKKYRIGYAFSCDGYSWELRLDEAGLDVSDDGWDSEMVEYPFVFEHKGHRYMLYNGNKYGRDGFGMAVLEL